MFANIELTILSDKPLKSNDITLIKRKNTNINIRYRITTTKLTTYVLAIFIGKYANIFVMI